MKTIRIVAICAIGMFMGHAWAQDRPVPSGTEASTQDVGGVTDASRGETGMAMSPARQQTYAQPGKSQLPGDPSRILSDTFAHH